MNPNNKQYNLGSPLLDQCWEKLCDLPKKKVYDYIDRVIFEFHCYGISSRNYYSKINFNFVLKILSDEYLCSQSGIESLVMHLRWDNKLITQEQRTALLDCLVEHYNFYTEDRIENEIFDFILDYNTPEVALNTYERIYEKHNPPNSSGLWCARKTLAKLEKGSPLWTRAMTLYVASQSKEFAGWNMLKGNTQNIFENILFEDSYVFNITKTENQVSLAIDIALSKKHPLYQPPKKDEQYCYKRGLIRFKNINSVNWIKETSCAYTAPNGRVDRGNIDAFSFTAGKYHLEGDWGEVAIQSPPPILTWI